MILPLCVITFLRVTVVSRSKGRATNTVTREKEKTWVLLVTSEMI